MNTKNSFPVEISELAQKKIKRIIEEKKIDVKYSLRLGVKSMGCHHQEYLIGFDTVQNDDEVYNYQKFKVLIRKKDFMYLIGIKLDFETDESGNQGFTFSKKNKI